MNFRSNETTTHLKEDRTLRAVERRRVSKVLIPVRETWPWVETLEAKIRRIEQVGRTTREE